MRKILSLILVFCLGLSCVLTSCHSERQDPDAGNGQQTDRTTADVSGSSAETMMPEKTDIPEDLPQNANTLSVTCSEGTDNCWNLNGKTLTFSGLTADTVCSISGEFDGQIVIDGGDDYKFELELQGVTLYNKEENPIIVLSGDKVTITAKKNSKNYIYDMREAISSEDSTACSSAIYAKCDLDLGGKGELIVISANNNGIHTKDDLGVKNLTLSVTCADNALKGNDGVNISGGVLTLIAKSGDGIKTTNSDVSSKGKQKGSVSLSGGTVTIYATCDGIDAAFDVEISDEAILNIYTDRYSPYSEDVEKSDEAEDVRYIRFTSKNYRYSIRYYNSESDFVWANATLKKSVNGGRETYYYYAFEKMEGYESIQLFVYSTDQAQGQDTEYVVKSDFITWNTSYDTLALMSRSGSLSCNWTNYTASVGGGMGGFPGMMDGNPEKGDYSTKGIKADNEIHVTGGTIVVESYDDALHANGETQLENGEMSTGNILISGGTLTLFSKDDGVHADGTVTVTGGKINVTDSYEGLEGNFVVIRGGDISVVSADDGINATATSGTGITFEGGKVMIYAGGDGIDSNSRTAYQGIVFSGGEITVISTSGGNSSLDTEQGYTYNGGTVLALCPATGMGNEATKCRNFSAVGSKTTMNLSRGQTLKVKVNGVETTSVTMPCQLSALVIYLGSPTANMVTE